MASKRGDKDYRFRMPQLEVNYGELVNVLDKDRIYDEEWVNLTLAADNDDYDSELLKFQYRSPVYNAFNTTVIGGHFTLNPAYGFTPTADLYYKGRNADAEDFSPGKESVDIGMGRYYCETIDINSHIRTLSLEAGVAEFQNFFAFHAHAVDRAKASIANTGRTPFFYKLGELIGTAVMFVAFPIITAAVMLTKFITNDILHLFDPSYYTVKPTMGVYWSVANTIVNTFAADRGIVGTLDFDKNKYQDKKDRIGYPIKINAEDKETVSKLLPHIFKKSGLIDVSGIVGRHQVLINKQLQNEVEAEKSGNADKMVEKFKTEHSADSNKPSSDALINSTKNLKSYKKIDPYHPLNAAQKDIEKDKDSSSLDQDVNKLLQLSKRQPLEKTLPQDKGGWWDSAASYYKSAISNGVDMINLQVEYVSDMSYTISNGVVDIPLKSASQSVTSAARSARFNLSDGNVAGTTLKSVAGAVADVAMGALSKISFGLTNVITALSGGAYIKYPKMYDNSSFSISGHSFKIRLNTPYNNPISHMMDIDLVLGCLLALSSPLETGRSSYISPFLLKAFMRGKMSLEKAIISNITISAASSNLSHNLYGAINDIEISFDIMNLDDGFSVPVPTGLFGLFEISLDDYSGINQMSKVITGQSRTVNKFVMRRALLNLNKLYGSAHQMLSPEMWGTRLGHSFVGNIHSMFVSADVSSVALFDD